MKTVEQLEQELEELYDRADKAMVLALLIGLSGGASLALSLVVIFGGVR